MLTDSGFVSAADRDPTIKSATIPTATTTTTTAPISIDETALRILHDFPEFTITTTTTASSPCPSLSSSLNSIHSSSPVADLFDIPITDSDEEDEEDEEEESVGNVLVRGGDAIVENDAVLLDIVAEDEEQ
ncbi:hypothetical protein HDU67_006821 [Dinochytrium kinnereticum]|nr:hypothetical protein HDU67_006821 [Dinochytrium kinnereticum]